MSTHVHIIVDVLLRIYVLVIEFSFHMCDIMFLPPFLLIFKILMSKQVSEEVERALAKLGPPRLNNGR